MVAMAWVRVDCPGCNGFRFRLSSAQKFQTSHLADSWRSPSLRRPLCNLEHVGRVAGMGHRRGAHRYRRDLQ